MTLWLRMMGLEKDVSTSIVDDNAVGRWGQWKKVVSGECVATFMSPLYLPEAVRAGLKVLPLPKIRWSVISRKLASRHLPENTPVFYVIM